MSCLESRIADDIYEYHSACLVFGVSSNDDDVYSKKAERLVRKMYACGYGNFRHEYLRQKIADGVIPLKGDC